MGRRLNRFLSGRPLLEQLTAKALNALIAAIEETKPIAGSGLYSKQTAGGIVLDVKRQEGGGGGTVVAAAPVVYPFDMTLTDAGAGLSDVSVALGSVGGLVPTNMFATLSVSQTGSWYLIATVTVTANTISSVALSIVGTYPVQPAVTANAPPTSFAILLGIIAEDVPWNVIKASPSPTSKFRYRAHRTGVVPGESAWDYYYTWEW